MSGTDRVRSELQAAVKARDPDSLLDVARSIVAAAKIPTRTVTTSPFSSTELGAALLVGAGAKWAAAMRRRLGTYVGKDSKVTLIGSLSLDDMHVSDQYELFEILLLAGDWRELPKGKGKPATWMRAPLSRRRKLLAAFATRDAKAASSAIAAIGRADPAKWSLLAYSLYKLAARRGMVIKVPRKYDF